MNIDGHKLCILIYGGGREKEEVKHNNTSEYMVPAVDAGDDKGCHCRMRSTSSLLLHARKAQHGGHHRHHHGLHLKKHCYDACHSCAHGGFTRGKEGVTFVTFLHYIHDRRVLEEPPPLLYIIYLDKGPDGYSPTPKGPY